MDKMNYPRGLVRYATLNGIANHWTKAQMFRHVLRPRVLIYTAILVVITAALMVSLWMRAPFRVDVVRDRASLARIVDDGWIENVYRLQVMNTTERPQRYRVTTHGMEGAVLEGGSAVDVGPAENRWVPVAVRISPELAQRLGPGAHGLEIRIESTGDDAATLDEHTTFVVPR
jgi:polyferredoxin